jgi:hypothetical protein
MCRGTFLVEDDPLFAVRQAVPRGAKVGLPHVHRDSLQLGALLVGELLVVRRQTLRLAIFGNELHGRSLEIADDRVTAVTFAKGLFVDTDVRHRLRRLPRPAPHDAAAHHPPGFIPNDPGDAARARDGTALLNQIDDQPLHQHRESTARLGPGA